MPIFQKKLYLVTDSRLYPHFEVAKKAVEAGCGVVQLRYKGNSGLEFYETAKKIKMLMMRRNGLFIVNDRADIALAVGADALHLGEEDLPINFARKICGDSMIIGLSTHSLEQAIEAENMGADYIGLGPVFPTLTKKMKYNPIELDYISKVKAKVRVPIVAIGGINRENARLVLAAGADAIAISSAICHAKNVEEEVKLLLEEIEVI